MDKGADTGDILSQVNFEISYQDDARNLYDKVVNIALIQIEEFIPALEKGTYTRIKQNEKESNGWRKRNEIDGEIDFRMNSRSIYNLNRALTRPYVGAHIKFNGTNYSVWKVKKSNDFQENIEPGKVLRVFDAAYSYTKAFRYPFIKKIYMMETLSETEFSLSTKEDSFVPNVFVDISEFMDQ